MPGSIDGKIFVGIGGAKSHGRKERRGGGRYGRGGRLRQGKRRTHESNRGNVSINKHRDGAY